MEYRRYFVYVVQYIVFLHYLQYPGGAYHVAYVSTPSGVDSAAFHETVVFHFVYTASCQYAAYLGFFTEGKNVRLNPVMLPCPHFAGYAHAALNLVEYKHYIIFVAYVPKLLEKLGSEMVVPAFALYCLYNDCANVVGAVFDCRLNLAYCFLFRPFHFFKVFFQRPYNLGIGDSRPVGELGKVLVFSRVGGVGKGEGVSAAPVEGIFEVNNPCTLFSALGIAFGYVLPDLPVHCHLQCVFYGQRVVIDYKQVIETFGSGNLHKGLNKVCHLYSVDIRVCHLVNCCPEDSFLELIVG